ncbi:MAG: hypothetical protein HC793_03320, partial [Aquincola sp.]|nr:hypothetical protein [Aquincola sp.]
MLLSIAPPHRVEVLVAEAGRDAEGEGLVDLVVRAAGQAEAAGVGARREGGASNVAARTGGAEVAAHRAVFAVEAVLVEQAGVDGVAVVVVRGDGGFRRQRDDGRRVDRGDRHLCQQAMRRAGRMHAVGEQVGVVGVGGDQRVRVAEQRAAARQDGQVAGGAGD